MRIIDYSKVIVRERQRKKIATAPLNELKESILGRGLINPPVVYPLEDGTYLLTAGERRYRAIGLIHKESKTFKCDTQTIGIGEFPVTFTDLETLLGQKEAELDENIIRVDLSWQEKAEALADIHKLRLAENPKQTFVETGRELASKSGTGNPTHIGTKIRESLVIAEHLDNPAVANARTASEAHTIILRQEEEKVLAELSRRRQAKMVNPDIVMRLGDSLELMQSMEPDQVDLTLVDPPFGIDASGGGFRARTVVHHNYEDDEETSWNIQKAILTECFRLSKQRANIFMFTDIKWWDRLQRVSAQIGWTPFRRPLIWGKSDSEGLAPWGSSGPRITTEFIFFATKGQKGLLASPIDYLRVNRVPRNERIHAAQKPVELLRRLIECATLPGDLVFDPCAGSGSTLIAARESQRRAIGIEKDSDYYNTAMANIFGGQKDVAAS